MSIAGMDTLVTCVIMFRFLAVGIAMLNCFSASFILAQVYFF